jgi:hypothetical protein
MKLRETTQIFESDPEMAKFAKKRIRPAVDAFDFAHAFEVLHAPAKSFTHRPAWLETRQSIGETARVACNAILEDCSAQGVCSKPPKAHFDAQTGALGLGLGTFDLARVEIYSDDPNDQSSTRRREAAACRAATSMFGASAAAFLAKKYALELLDQWVDGQAHLASMGQGPLGPLRTIRARS